MAREWLGWGSTSTTKCRRHGWHEVIKFWCTWLAVLYTAISSWRNYEAIPRSPLGLHSKRELISGCFIPISWTPFGTAQTWHQATTLEAEHQNDAQRGAISARSFWVIIRKSRGERSSCKNIVLMCSQINIDVISLSKVIICFVFEPLNLCPRRSWSFSGLHTWVAWTIWASACWIQSSGSSQLTILLMWETTQLAIWWERNQRGFPGLVPKNIRRRRRNSQEST